MVRLNDNPVAKEKRVRFSVLRESNGEHKTSFPNASKPRSHQLDKDQSKVERSSSLVNKNLVRNVEQSVSSYQVHLDQRKPLKNKFLGTNCDLTVETTYKTKFEAPELYSSLSVAKSIQVVASTGTTSTLQYEHLNPDTRKAIQDKILLKLNIPLEEKLYRDLVPVKVEDYELLGKQSTRKEIAPVCNKDIEPRLSDFCLSSNGREFCMWTKPVLHFDETLKFYNGFSLYKSCHMWQS